MTSSSPRARRRMRHLLGAVVGTAALAAAAPAFAADGTLMAKLGSTTDEATAAAVAERTGLTHVNTLPEIGWATYEYEGDRAAAHAALRGDRAVFRIDFTAPGETLRLHFTPRDEVFGQGATVSLNNQPVAQAAWHFTRPDFPAAWDIAKGNAQTRIAVIDSEFATDHPDLQTKFATGRNFDSGAPSGNYRTSNVLYNAADQRVESIHGTHVAGLAAAASDNQIGVAGACLDCVVLPYKISMAFQSGGGPTDQKFVADLTEALQAAGDSDAVVINLSLGTTRDHAPMRDAINYARGKGKTIIAAAGNSQQAQPGVANYPAAYPGVVAVAATMPDDRIAEFSTNGDFVDVAAPGHPILSTTDKADQGPTHGVGYTTKSGTSMAAPIVAGLVGLMKSIRPDLTPDEVEAILVSTAVDLGASGRDPLFGAGRINALRAVQAARDYVRPVAPPPPPAPAPAPTLKRAPAVTAGVLKVSRSGRATVRIRCNGNAVCRGRVVLRSAGKLRIGRAAPKVITFGSGAYNVRPGRVAAVQVTLPRASRSYFTRSRKGVRVQVQLTPRKGEGAVRRVSRMLNAAQLATVRR